MPPPGKDQFDALYQSARAKWPKVQWNREAFRKHLAGETVKHLADLYLGGAAGFREQTAWETIEKELGPPTRRVLERQPTADYSLDDLWADAITKLMEGDRGSPPLPDGKQPARIVRYRGLVPLLNYLIVVAKRLAIQRQRQTRPILSLAGGSDDDAPQQEFADARVAAPDADSVEAEVCEKMRVRLLAGYQTLMAEQQFLITMVYRQGMKQKDAGALIGWSEFKTSRSLSAAMDKLKQSLSDLKEAAWTPAIAAAWEGCVNNCWKGTDSLQVPRSVPSKPTGIKQTTARGSG
jgi:DNA-directed RNA polymerase specialized sigma24 family protein